jgi:hypothetical protein
MKTYEFTLVIESPSGYPDDMDDAIFEAGCDDALLSHRKGVTYLNFDRQAENLEDAVISAIQQVERAGLKLRVRRVEPSDIVTSAEIARRLCRSRQHVQQMISGTRGDGDFPLPVAGITAKTMVWSWKEVAEWLLLKNKISDQSVYENAATLKHLNESLDARKNDAELKDIRRISRRLPQTDSEAM